MIDEVNGHRHYDTVAEQSRRSNRSHRSVHSRRSRHRIRLCTCGLVATAAVLTPPSRSSRRRRARARSRWSSPTRSSSRWTRPGASSRTGRWPSTAPTSPAVDTAEAIRKQFRGAETIDAAGQIVMPGLINTHTHAPMVLYPRAGRRPRADGVAEQVHLPGRGQDGVTRDGPRGHAAGGARDDPVRHDDLRRHVLLRGGDRAGDEGGRAARRAGPDDHPVPGGRCEDAGRFPRARREVHRRVQGRSAHHAGRGAARDVHARRPHAARRARAGAPQRRADDHSPRRDTRRGDDRAGALQVVAGRVPGQPRLPRPRRARRPRRVGDPTPTSPC